MYESEYTGMRGYEDLRLSEMSLGWFTLRIRGLSSSNQTDTIQGTDLICHKSHLKIKVVFLGFKKRANRWETGSPSR